MHVHIHISTLSTGFSCLVTRTFIRDKKKKRHGQIGLMYYSDCKRTVKTLRWWRRRDGGGVVGRDGERCVSFGDTCSVCRFNRRRTHKIRVAVVHTTIV